MECWQRRQDRTRRHSVSDSALESASGVMPLGQVLPSALKKLWYVE